MKNLLKNFQAWKDKNKFTMFLGTILSLIVIAIPFIVGIFAVVNFIEGETTYMLLSALLFVAFGVSYVMFSKYMNKI